MDDRAASRRRLPRRSVLKSRRRALSIVVLVAAIAIVAATLALARSAGRVEQPVAFPHRLHLEDVGLQCTDCHRHVMDGLRATIPNIEVCADCHREAQGESAEEAVVVRHVESGEPIRWKKVYAVPSHVFFSHRRHAALAGIACEICHGAIGERSLPVTEALVSLKMNDCLRCHEASGVSNDCILCHR